MRMNLNQESKVTVIIPTYNRAHLIQKSMQSVLNQTYKNLELIIVDDSNDDTEKKVKEIKDDRVVYIKNPQRMGVSKARNIAIAKATGVLIAFQDSDDQWYADKLEKQVSHLLKLPNEYAAVYCGMEYFDIKTDKVIGIELTEINFRESYAKGLLQTPPTQTILIKKNVLDEVGYFDERLKAAEDTELTIRVSRKYLFGFVKEPLIRVAKNHDSLMGNAQNYLYAYDIIYDKHNDFLSNEILFGLSKNLASYWILKEDFQKAKKYVERSLKHKKNLTTLTQYCLILIAPLLLKFIYKLKYKNGIPHPTQPGRVIEENRKDF